MKEKFIRCFTMTPVSHSKKSLNNRGYSYVEVQKTNPDFMWIYKEKKEHDINQDEEKNNMHLSGFIPITLFEDNLLDRTSKVSCIIMLKLSFVKSLKKKGIDIKETENKDFQRIYSTNESELNSIISKYKLIQVSDID